jgi:gamma-glutamyl:cysteine ligase YbdK (ATP-grasp superfamily)
VQWVTRRRRGALGRDIQTTEFSPEDWLAYDEKLKLCLTVLRDLIDCGDFDAGCRLVGIEVEADLADDEGRALPINDQVLKHLLSDVFRPELARFTLEFSALPCQLVGDCFRRVETTLDTLFSQAQAAARSFGAQAIFIGILPTLTYRDVAEHNLSTNARYKALNDNILAARGEPILIDIQGEESLRTVTNSIVFEAACTSTQIHLQVAPEESAAYWNAAQALSAPLVAVAANSPFFLGKQLHHETRIALFLQAIDTRTKELVQQGAPPRVWFGERWLREGLFELFEENVRYFPSLLPICEDEDPREVIAAGGTPLLPELTLHNGTIYRWNRPIYDVSNGRPHFRIENRVLPSGPSIPDAVANIALYFGLLNALAHAERPVWEEMSFEAAADNFFTAARLGLGARLSWPGIGTDVPVTELLLDYLIPLARDGLRDWSLEPRDIDRYLEIITQRTATGQNGAAWQIATHRALIDRYGRDRSETEQRLVQQYVRHSQEGLPVHCWPVEA